MTYTNEELLEMFQSDFSNSKKEVSSKTVDTYTANIKYLLTFLNNKPILEITEDDILNYMESVNANISKSTYNNRVFSFRTLFNVLRVNRKLKDLNINNPANDVETYRKVDNKRKTELSLVEQSMLIKYSKDAREKAIMVVLLKMGLRITELIEIKLDDYLYRNEFNEILINGKGNKDRVIYFDEECIGVVDEYLMVRKNTCDRLFTSYGQNGVLDSCNLSRRIKNIAKRSGYFRDDRINELCNHLMRTSCFSTMLNEDDIPLDVVQEWAGHTSINTTRIYAHTDKMRMRKCVEGRKSIAVC